MKLIEKISEQIDHEISGAEKYIMCAYEYKDSYKEIADAYYGLAMDELVHSDKLHTQLLKILAKYKMDKPDMYNEIMVIYDFLHKHAIKKALNVKIMLEMYKK